MKSYKVAVFYNDDPKSRVRFSAYLRDYNPSWKGCEMVNVCADSGKEAKKMAIEIVKNSGNYRLYRYKDEPIPRRI